MPEDAPFHGVPPGGALPDRTWWVRARDGVRLRASIWQAPSPRGHVLFLPGRTEFLEKLAVPAAELVVRGFSVASLDWRGQGLSDRLIDPSSKGHVQDFAEYQVDFDAFLEDPAVASLPGSRLILGHSMGGLIALAALQRPNGAGVQGLVLSAPLLGLLLPMPVHAFAWAAIQIARLTGRTHRWPPFGEVKTTYVLTDPPNNVLTSDADIWDWLVQTATDHPEMMLGMPSIAWIDAANREMSRIGNLPGPACQTCCLLGSDERLVHPGLIRDWASAHGAQLIEISDARHEVLLERPELRANAWQGIDRFLNGLDLPTSAGQ